MKKIFIPAFVLTAVLLQYCSSTKIQAGQPQVKINYIADVQPLVLSNCSPCHFPEKGRVKALNTYAAMKDEIDDVVERIQKNPGEKGFMPMKHPKLSDSVIHIFQQWKTDGLLEQ